MNIMKKLTSIDCSARNENFFPVLENNYVGVSISITKSTRTVVVYYLI